MSKLSVVVFLVYLGIVIAFRSRARFGARREYSSGPHANLMNMLADDCGKGHSFVQDELRPVAMKLHTRDQAPREGQQEAQTPFTSWEPSRQDYTQFLVDSLMVYDTFEQIVGTWAHSF